MKTFILLFVSIPFFLFAQDSTTDTREKLIFGLKAGVNYSNVYDSKGDNFKVDGKIGFAGGAFLSIPIGKFLGVQPEVLFSQKGFYATGNVIGQPYDLTRTTNYIDVPLYIVFKPTNFLSIMAGPQFSFLIQQKDKFTIGNTSVEQRQQFDNENIRKNTFCFAGGVDINLDNFVIGLRTGWDIYNNNGDGSSTTPRYKNAWVQGTLGFRFY